MTANGVPLTAHQGPTIPQPAGAGTLTGTLPAPNVHSRELFDEAYGGREAEYYSGLLAELIQFGRPGRILDLGAGLGLFTELARRWGLDVVGLEGSAEAVSLAHRRVPGLPMLAHDLGDPLPFADGTVATVVLNQVVEHLDPQRYAVLLRECHRVLAVGGRVLIYSPSRYNRRERGDPTHINLRLPSELHQDVVAAGFQVCRRPDGGFWFFPSGHRLLFHLSRALMTVLPHDWIAETANVFAEKRPQR